MRKKPSVWLFPGRKDHCGDKPIDTKTVWHACREAAKRAAIHKSLHPHTLRHCFATHLTLPTGLGGLLETSLRRPQYVLRYLGRYTHRVAISNHRLVSFDNGQVTFRYRDSADHNKQKLLLLALNEFLCRFLLHILPQSFVRIRHFGFLANRRRSTLLPLCFRLLGTTPQPPAEERSSSTEDPAELYRCPYCGAPMKVIERLTAAEILLRSPPEVTVTA